MPMPVNWPLNSISAFRFCSGSMYIVYGSRFDHHHLQGDVDVLVVVEVLALAEALAGVGEQRLQLACCEGPSTLSSRSLISAGELFLEPAVQAADRPSRPSRP